MRKATVTLHSEPALSFMTEYRATKGLSVKTNMSTEVSFSPRPPGASQSAADSHLSSTERLHTTPGHASLHHSPKLILVVDDDATVRHSLALVLQLEHFAVRLANDGREAVRQFLEGPPDLILLDLNMPDIDGWQAFQIMTKLYPFVPVIIITARSGQAQRAAQAGIDVVLEKPLHIPALLENIRRLLARPEPAHLAKVLDAWRALEPPGKT